MRNLVIFGDTPFAGRLCKYISIEGKDRVVAFTQEKDFITHSVLLGIPVLAFEDLHSELNDDIEIIIGIGYTNMNTLRAKIYDKCKQHGYRVGTYVSTRAIVYTDQIGEGSFICPGAIIGPDCKLGVCNYMESASVLTHDNTLGDFNFISTNSVFGGFAVVGSKCFFGLQSTIKDSITVADNCLIGSSANVLKSIVNSNSVIVGNPARLLVGKEASDTTI